MFKTPKALEGLARARVVAANKTKACKLAEICCAGKDPGSRRIDV
jgi:hypothetical protein